MRQGRGGEAVFKQVVWVGSERRGERGQKHQRNHRSERSQGVRKHGGRGELGDGGHMCLFLKVTQAAKPRRDAGDRPRNKRTR